MIILGFHNVKKDYLLGETTVHALRGVDLAVEQGEFAAILGASGSGKTTLLNLAGAIDDPSEGAVIINGKDISRLSDNDKAELRNRTIGYVFQTFNLVSVRTALENVMLALQIRGGMREIKSVLDVYLRYIYSLEERAGQASTIIEWQVTDRLQIFNINTAAVGGGNTEFNSLLSKSFMAGVEVHF